MTSAVKVKVMKNVATLENLDDLIQKEEALLVLFGGEQCGVCQALKPKIIEALKMDYPQIKAVYIDCQQTTEICAQKGVFTLPVVQVYFSGQKFKEEIRSFSLNKLFEDIRRPYEILFKK